MADQFPPSQPPDPARSYERAKPEAEPGMGRLDNDEAAPSREPDRIKQAIRNDQRPEHQINAEDEADERTRNHPGQVKARPAPVQPDHSMLEEEPDGWDLAPADIHNPQHKRHPRKEGKGGTP